MNAIRCNSCGRESPNVGGTRFCCFCGALLRGTPSADAWIGKTVAGRFAIVRQLAEGGGGRVYVAAQAIGSTKRPVALKMLLPEHASNPEMVERFLRECETVSLIEHANVVRIYDFGEAEAGVLYIAMELVPGASLAAVIQEEGALEPERVLHVFAQICRGIAAAHDRGIVHRDLKPDNLMLVRESDEPELVKVLDFGIAKTLGGSLAAGGAGLTRMGAVLGSPPYMSPEQFLGGEIDARTDVYALGVVAYEMFTGTLPFEADDLNAWATQHVTAEPRPFNSTPAGRRISEPLRRAVLQAMAKNPADRPATARAFWRELSASASASEVSAASPPAVLVPIAPPGRARRRARGGDVARWAAVALLAAAAGSTMVLVGTDFSGVAAGHAAVLAAQTAPPSPTPTPSAVASSLEGASADVPVAPPLPLAPAPAAAAPPLRPPKLNIAGCERAMQASSCEEARAAQRTCPDAAGLLHHRVHERVNRLCLAPDHHDSENEHERGAEGTPTRHAGMATPL